MKIYHFIYDHKNNPWVGGGGAVRVHEIYKRLASRHDVTVVTGKYPGAGDYEEGDLKFHFSGTGMNNYVLSTFCYAAKAAAFLRKHPEADIVVEDFAPWNPVFSFIWRRDAILQVHQKEGMHLIKRYLFPGILFFLMEKFYPRAFRRHIAVTERMKARHGLPEGAAVISNGFDGRLLNEEASDGHYALYLGRLEVYSKGVDVLFNALRYLKGVNLKIAGKGKDESRVREMAGRLRPENGVVEMLGFLEGQEKVEAMRNCTFMVMPSRYEGHPLTLLEAAACGKPVVISDIPELRFAVEAGFGVSFRTGDAGDLAEKIAFLADNALLRREMGQKARQYASNFTWDRIAETYERFLLEATAGKEDKH